MRNLLMRVGAIALALVAAIPAPAQVASQANSDDVIRIIQRGTTKSVTINQIVNTPAQKLKRAASRAAVRNPEIDGLATGVTTSISTTFDNTLTKRYSGAPMIDAFSVTGGSTYYYSAGSRWVFPSGAYAGSSTGGNLGNSAPPDAPDASAWGYEVHFQTDAPKIQVRINGGVTTHGYRVRVNGQYVDKAGSLYLAGANNFIIIDFAGVRALRTITLEGEFNVGLTSIDVDGISRVSKVRSVERTVAIGFGDSLTEGLSNVSPIIQHMGWLKRLGRRMGWSDVRQAGVGGTGYIRVGTNGRLPIINQISRIPVINPDLAPADVDVVTVFAGVNDITPFTSATPWTVTAPNGRTFISTGANDTATYQSLVLATLQSVRSTFPNAMIFVLGVWPANSGPSADVITMENTIKAAAAQLGDANAFFIPVSTATTPVMDGTGNLSAPTGTGSADVMLYNDALHPSPFGHEVLAQRFEQSIRGILNGQPIASIERGRAVSPANDNHADLRAAA